MRQISNGKKRAFLKQVDQALLQDHIKEPYDAELEKLSRRFRLGRLDKIARNDAAKDLLNLVAPRTDANVIQRRIVVSGKEAQATSLRIYADAVNHNAREESIKYPIHAFRARITRFGAQIFNGYVPFKITRHALIRLMERSNIAWNPNDAGLHGMDEIAHSLSAIIHALPLQLMGALSARQNHFAIRIADGILLCEHFEETTRYEAALCYVTPHESSIGRFATPIFGEPEQGVCRVVLGKTWIGPNEIRENQARLLSECETALNKNTRLAIRLMEADLFRSPNWIDRGAPDYEEPPIDEIANLTQAVALIMARQEYRDEFTPRDAR